MTYIRELNDIPPALIFGESIQVLDFWPKATGEGSGIVPFNASVEIYQPKCLGGELLQTGNAGTLPSLGPIPTDGVYRLTITLDISDKDKWKLGEHYRAVYTYKYGGGTSGLSARDTQPFDIATEPYVCRVSLNDLQEEEIDITDVIERQAMRLSDGKAIAITSDQHAATMGLKAWSDVRSWIRTGLRDQGKILPRAILDPEEITRIVTVQAMSRVYRAEGGSPESDSRSRAEELNRKAYAMFKDMPEVPYDETGDHIEDRTVRGPRVYTPSRTWR